MKEVRQITGEDELARVRQLCWDYREFLFENGATEAHVVNAFYPEDRYRQLMDDLPRIHARPKGAILGLFVDGVMEGCGMSYEVQPGMAEIKRIYVTPAARGGGAGRFLTQALIDQVKADGYDRLVLDTSIGLTTARALYESMGFKPRGPFYDVPPEAEGAVCWYEYPLR